MSQLIRKEDFAQVTIDIEGDQCVLMESERQEFADAANARLQPLVEAFDRLEQSLQAHGRSPATDTAVAVLLHRYRQLKGEK